MHTCRKCVWMMLAFVIGCNQAPDDGVTFSDVTQSQPISISDFSALTFADKDGNPVELASIVDHEFLVLVVTRGWNGGVCFYCASQTSRWARRFDELEPYNAQLAVIFPVASGEDAVKLDALSQSITSGDIPNQDIPYPILLDINLAGVDQLGIRAELAKPATYIIDRAGRVRFAYVGESLADRPSIDSILKQLEQLNQ